MDKTVEQTTRKRLEEENAKLRHRLAEQEQKAQKYAAIVSVSAALRVAASRQEMVALLLEEVMSLFQASGALLLTRNPIYGDVVVEQGSGIWEYMTGMLLSTNDSSPIDLPDSQSRKQWQKQIRQCLARIAFEQQEPLSSFVACVPLIAQEETIGILGIGCEHSIGDEDMQVLYAIGDMVSNAIHRVTLHEQTERRLKRIHALHAIDQTITTSLSLRVTLNVLIYQVTTQLGVHAAAVLLYDPETERLDYAAGRGFYTAHIKQSSMRLDEGFAGQTAMGQAFFRVADIRQADVPCVRQEMIVAEGFFTYYGVPLIARDRIKGVLELFHRSPLLPDQEWIDFMGTLAGQASIAIDNAEMFAQLQQSNKELSRAYDATIEGWARALELRDAETEGHCRRVTDLTTQLAIKMGVSKEDLVHIRRGAILHDIGKMAIPDAILLKAGPLTPAERAAMEQHPTYAYNLLSSIPFLQPALDIPYCHHEKWDGTGYPRGLKGEEISLSARIFAIVDVWDALRSDRPYRKAWPVERVYRYIRSLSGSHFDPAVVEAFLAMRPEDQGPTSE
jgi:putative nucleotidyltransferase with HDIG domain